MAYKPLQIWSFSASFSSPISSHILSFVLQVHVQVMVSFDTETLHLFSSFEVLILLHRISKPLAWLVLIHHLDEVKGLVPQGNYIILILGCDSYYLYFYNHIPSLLHIQTTHLYDYLINE